MFTPEKQYIKGYTPGPVDDMIVSILQSIDKGSF